MERARLRFYADRRPRRVEEEGAFKAAGRALGRSLAMPGADEVGPAGRIDCLNCLFAEVGRHVPEICSFHAGVIEGLGFREEGGRAVFVA